MTHDSTGVAWAKKVDLAGPLGEVAFLDATWQGAPVWRYTDEWVATDLAYDGPPWPGLLIRLHAGQARGQVCRSRGTVPMPRSTGSSRRS
jgi:hypothetical protein